MMERAMITQEYIDRIYTKLSEMDVQLDADPIEFGPSRLNYKVSEVRGFLSATEKIFMEVSHNQQKLKRSLLVKQTEYSLEQTQLIANDPHVRSGRSQKEREALAATRLVHIQSKINDFTLSVHDLEDLLVVIKAKRSDLKDIQGRLRDQLKLCQEQIALGQRWGSKSFNINRESSTSLNDIVDDFVSQGVEKEEKSSGEEIMNVLSSTERKELPTNNTASIAVIEKISLDKVNTNVDDVNLDELFDEWT
jgi:hypothetical protein